MALYEAYEDGKLPRDGGFVITEHLDDSSRYARYEVISYGNVKDIYKVDEGLMFQADGKKLYLLFEPLSYSSKHVEPAYRDESHRIPCRNKELDVCTTKRQERIMIAKEVIETYTSFTVANETGLHTSYIVYKDESAIRTVAGFFEQSFWKTLNISRTDARSACEMMSKQLEEVITAFGND